MAWMMRFVSPYRASKIFLVSSYIFAVTAIPSTSILGSPSKFPRRKTCLLIVEREASSSMDDRNCSQNRDQFSTSPLKGYIFIAGSFTEREAEPVGAGADCWVGLLMLNRVVESDRQLSIRRLAFWIALFVLSIYSSQLFISSSYSLTGKRSRIESSSKISLSKFSFKRPR